MFRGVRLGVEEQARFFSAIRCFDVVADDYHAASESSNTECDTLLLSDSQLIIPPCSTDLPRTRTERCVEKLQVIRSLFFLTVGLHRHMLSVLEECILLCLVKAIYQGEDDGLEERKQSLRAQGQDRGGQKYRCLHMFVDGCYLVKASL